MSDTQMYDLPDDLHAKLAEWTADLRRARNDAIWAMLLPLLREHFELVVDRTGTPVALRCKPAEENAELRAALAAALPSVEHHLSLCDEGSDHHNRVAPILAQCRAALGQEAVRDG